MKNGGFFLIASVLLGGIALADDPNRAVGGDTAGGPGGEDLHGQPANAPTPEGTPPTTDLHTGPAGKPGAAGSKKADGPES